MGKLADKVAIITGAGQGVGLGIARTFATAGASLVITGRTEDKLRDVQKVDERLVILAKAVFGRWRPAATP